MANERKPKSATERANRRAEVLEWLSKVGPFSIPASTLAKKWNCTPQMIYVDRDYLLKRMKIENPDLVGKKVFLTVQKNLAITDEIKAQGDPKVRLDAVQKSNQAALILTEIMERYEWKKKVPDKKEVKVEKVEFELIRSQNGTDNKD